MIIVLNLSCVYPNDNFNGIINNNIHKILTLSYKKTNMLMMEIYGSLIIL